MDPITLTKIILVSVSSMIIICYIIAVISLIKLRKDSTDILYEMKKDFDLYEHEIINECEKIKEEVHHIINDKE